MCSALISGRNFGSVCNGGRNFGLFVLRKCSAFISGRNFGLFVLRGCSVCNGGRNFGLFVLRKCSVSQFWPICISNV
jgi:hypothetical protein